MLRQATLLAALSGLIAACAVGDGGEAAGSAAPTPLAHGSGDASFRLVADQPADAMAAALALQQVFRDVAGASVPTVVQIDTTQTRQRFGSAFEQPSGTGSGVIYDRTGNTYFVLTNAHVIQNTDGIRLTLHDGTEISQGVRLVGADRNRDVAVLRFASREPLAVAIMGRFGRRAGGRPGAGGGQPLRLSVHGDLRDHQRPRPRAAPDPVGGVHPDRRIHQSGKLRRRAGCPGRIGPSPSTPGSPPTGGAPASGSASRCRSIPRCSSPTNCAKAACATGISASNCNRPATWDSGATARWVTSVYSRSPAERAGFLAGDVIIAVDGQAVTGTGEVMRNIGGAGPGTRLALTVLRDGVEQEITVRLGERPESEDDTGTDWPGIFVVDDPPGQGVGVEGVSRTSAARAAGLRSGDVIIEIDGGTVADVEDFYAALREADSAELTVMRPSRAGTRTFTVTIDR